MANYTQTTFFAPKDSLPINNPGKTIFGAAYDVEFGNIATAVNSKANLSGGNSFSGAQSVTNASGTILTVQSSSGTAFLNINGGGSINSSVGLTMAGGSGNANTANLLVVGTAGGGAAAGDLLINSTGSIDFAPNAGNIIANFTAANLFQCPAGVLGTTGTTASTATATPVTIFTAAAPGIPGLYLVTANITSGTNPAVSQVLYIVKVVGTIATAVSVSTASQLTVTTSGLNFQLTQTTGSNQVMTYDVLRIL